MSRLSTAENWPVTPIAARTASGSRGQVVAGDRALAAVGARSAWTGSAPWWSCRRRSGRAARRPCPPGRPGRCRRARPCRRTTCAARGRDRQVGCGGHGSSSRSGVALVATTVPRERAPPGSSRFHHGNSRFRGALVLGNRCRRRGGPGTAVQSACRPAAGSPPTMPSHEGDRRPQSDPGPAAASVRLWHGCEWRGGRADERWVLTDETGRAASARGPGGCTEPLGG